MPLTPTNIDQVGKEVFTCRDEGLKKVLSSILNLSLQYEAGEHAIVDTISTKLSGSQSRKEGLENLDLVIDNCDPSIIAENGVEWIRYCLINFPGDGLRELKLRLIGKIIDVSHADSNFSTTLMSDKFSKLVNNCVTTSHVNPKECQIALETLTIFMQYYPSQIGRYSKKVEDFILIFLDSPNSELVQAAALAFHYLQQIGSGGSHGINHKSNFTNNFHKLCRTVNTLYNMFFENEIELFHTASSDDDTFEFLDDPAQDSQTLMHVTARRICNVFKFIEAMIKNKYPVAKETKPKLLLEVLNRAIAIHKCLNIDNVESLGSHHFSVLLSGIQCAALKLLRLFIIWYQTNCLPFAYSVSKVIVDSIERIYNCNCFNCDSLYQESAYRALSEWLPIAKSSLHPQFQNQLIKYILKEITPVKSKLTLTMSEAATAGKRSQKAKRQAMANRIISSANPSSNYNDSASLSERSREVNICRLALIALRRLLESTKLDLKSDLLKDLYKSIFDSLISIQCGKPLRPYTNAQCQANLYEVLLAIYHQNALPILPPLQTTLAIFNRGVNDNDRFVAGICNQGLSILESFCQPICSSFYLWVGEGEWEEVEGPDGPVQDGGGREGENVERGSVDLDASTEGFASHNKSGIRDFSDAEDRYFVRNTDSRRSTPTHRDDLNNTAGQYNGEITVEELMGDPPIKLREQNFEGARMFGFPVVTAPSEDGNEIIEVQYEEEEWLVGGPESEEVPPDGSEQDISETRTTADTTTQYQELHESVDLGESEIEQVTEIILIESQILSGDPTSSSEREGDSKEDSIDKNKQQEDKDIMLTQQEEVSNNYCQIDAEEPVAKKAKLITDDFLVESTTSKAPEDPDASYLEEDSFVDEVKDYY